MLRELRLLSLCTMTFLAWSVVPRHAAAEDRKALPPSAATMYMFGKAGFGGPFGWGGMGLGLQPTRFWNLELGGGFDLGGPEAGFGTGLHLVLRHGDTLGLFVAGRPGERSRRTSACKVVSTCSMGSRCAP